MTVFERYDFVTGISDRENGRFVSSAIGGKNGIATLTFGRIRVVCKENYTGSDCGIMVCETQDDSTGHFNCDINGNKVCLPGYQNPETNCVDALNPITLTTISNVAITPMESISTRTTETQTSSASAHVLQI